MCFLLEQGLLGSLGPLLGKEGSELTAGAGVGQLAGGLCSTAAVLHVQVVHEQDLENTTTTRVTTATTAPRQQQTHTAFKSLRRIRVRPAAGTDLARLIYV